MKPLIIGPVERAAIHDLRERAAANKLDMYQMNARAIGRGPPSDITLAERGDRSGFPDLTISLPTGYDVTLTIEQHPGGVWCRHMSVSVDRYGKLPHARAVEMLMQEFGFVHQNLNELPFWKEEFGPGRFAINVLEPLDGDMHSIMRSTP